MPRSPHGARYLTAGATGVAPRRSRRSPLVALLSALFAGVMLLLSLPLAAAAATPAEERASQQVEAGGAMGVFCSTGVGDPLMESKFSWQSPIGAYPHPDAKPRKWTLQEAFGNSYAIPTYHGEGGADEFLVAEKEALPDDKKVGNYNDISGTLDGARNLGNCTIISLVNEFTSVMIFGPTSVIVTVTSSIVNFAFNPSIICRDPANPDGFCFNLVAVLGGVSNTPGDGIIGALTSSVYLPLLVIAVAIAGLWVGYTGLVKRKFREGLFGALWISLSVIFGLIALYNPTLLAKAPMAVSNAVSTCVIGAFNGSNCMSGGTTGSGIDQPDPTANTSGNICRSIASTSSIDEQMAFSVNGLTCSIWKAFVLEPYSQANFGASFTDLDTRDPNAKIHPVLEKAKIDGNTFCINLSTSKSVNELSGKRLQLDSNYEQGVVCNLAAYQMFIMTDAGSSGGGAPASSPPAAGGVDYRWYNVIVTAANDPGVWNQWGPSFTGSMQKLMVGGLGLFSSVIGSLILIVTSVFALVYYISAVILMAVAPLFLLIGVHPSRGKKIMLGWLEKVISNVLKYLASAIFLLVAVAFYAAILSNASNIGVTFIFVILISGALFMNRKEIIDIIGKVNMGGEQMSNAFTERLGQSARGVGSLALAGVGAGAGAALAGGDITSGIKDGIKRDLKRGSGNAIVGKTVGGVVTNAARQFDRDVVDARQDLKTQARNENTTANETEKALTDRQDEYRKAALQRETYEKEVDSSSTVAEQVDSKAEVAGTIETNNVSRIELEAESFAQAQSLLNRIEGLKVERAQAYEAGDTVRVQQLDGQMQTLQTDADNRMAEVSDSNRAVFESNYQANLDESRRTAEEAGEPLGVADARFIAAGDSALQNMRSAVDNFATQQRQLNRIQELKNEQAMAEAAGRSDDLLRIQAELGHAQAGLAVMRNEDENKATTGQLSDNYTAQTTKEKHEQNAVVTTDEYRARGAAEATLANREHRLQEYRENEETLMGETREAFIARAVAKETNAHLQKKDQEWQPGQNYTTSSAKKTEDELKEIRKKAKSDAEAQWDGLVATSQAREAQRAEQAPTVLPPEPGASPRPPRGDDDTDPPTGGPTGGPAGGAPAASARIPAAETTAAPNEQNAALPQVAPTGTPGPRQAQRAAEEATEALPAPDSVAVVGGVPQGARRPVPANERLPLVDAANAQLPDEPSPVAPARRLPTTQPGTPTAPEAELPQYQEQGTPLQVTPAPTVRRGVAANEQLPLADASNAQLPSDPAPVASSRRLPTAQPGAPVAPETELPAQYEGQRAPVVAPAPGARPSAAGQMPPVNEALPEASVDVPAAQAPASRRNVRPTPEQSLPADVALPEQTAPGGDAPRRSRRDAAPQAEATVAPAVSGNEPLAQPTNPIAPSRDNARTPAGELPLPTEVSNAGSRQAPVAAPRVAEVAPQVPGASVPAAAIPVTVVPAAAGGASANPAAVPVVPVTPLSEAQAPQQAAPVASGRATPRPEVTNEQPAQAPAEAAPAQPVSRLPRTVAPQHSGLTPQGNSVDAPAQAAPASAPASVAAPTPAVQEQRSAPQRERVTPQQNAPVAPLAPEAPVERLPEASQAAPARGGTPAQSPAPAPQREASPRPETTLPVQPQAVVAPVVAPTSEPEARPAPQRERVLPSVPPERTAAPREEARQTPTRQEASPQVEEPRTPAVRETSTPAPRGNEPRQEAPRPERVERPAAAPVREESRVTPAEPARSEPAPSRPQPATVQDAPVASSRPQASAPSAPAAAPAPTPRQDEVTSRPAEPQRATPTPVTPAPVTVQAQASQAQERSTRVETPVATQASPASTPAASAPKPASAPTAPAPQPVAPPQEQPKRPEPTPTPTPVQTAPQAPQAAAPKAQKLPTAPTPRQQAPVTPTPAARQETPAPTPVAPTLPTVQEQANQNQEQVKRTETTVPTQAPAAPAQRRPDRLEVDDRQRRRDAEKPEAPRHETPANHLPQRQQAAESAGASSSSRAQRVENSVEVPRNGTYGANSTIGNVSTQLHGELDEVNSIINRLEGEGRSDEATQLRGSLQDATDAYGQEHYGSVERFLNDTREKYDS